MYIVLEIQKNAHGNVGVIPTAYDTLQKAVGKYHQILSVAAESELPMHSAAILTEDGSVLRNEGHQHSTDTGV